MKKIILLTTCLFAFFPLFSQHTTLNPYVNQDSLFSELIETLPKNELGETLKKDFKKIYKKGEQEEKEFMLFILSQPQSSANELIQNYEENSVAILKLKSDFQRFVPKEYFVSIEVSQANNAFQIPKSIDLTIIQISDSSENKLLFEASNIPYNSTQLEEAIEVLGWNRATIIEIEKLLDKANCISIETGNTKNEIGFARSGMGKYSYLIYTAPISTDTRNFLEDSCEYIIFSDTVVFMYSSGAIGSECIE